LPYFDKLTIMGIDTGADSPNLTYGKSPSQTTLTTVIMTLHWMLTFHNPHVSQHFFTPKTNEQKNCFEMVTFISGSTAARAWRSHRMKYTVYRSIPVVEICNRSVGAWITSDALVSMRARVIRYGWSSRASHGQLAARLTPVAALWTTAWMTPGVSDYSDAIRACVGRTPSEWVWFNAPCNTMQFKVIHRRRSWSWQLTARLIWQT